MNLDNHWVSNHRMNRKLQCTWTSQTQLHILLLVLNNDTIQMILSTQPQSTTYYRYYIRLYRPTVCCALVGVRVMYFSSCQLVEMQVRCCWLVLERCTRCSVCCWLVLERCTRCSVCCWLVLGMHTHIATTCSWVHNVESSEFKPI